MWKPLRPSFFWRKPSESNCGIMRWGSAKKDMPSEKKLSTGDFNQLMICSKNKPTLLSYTLSSCVGGYLSGPIGWLSFVRGLWSTKMWGKCPEHPMQFLQAVLKYSDFQRNPLVSSISTSTWNIKLLARYTFELHFCECIFWYLSGLIGFGHPFSLPPPTDVQYSAHLFCQYVQQY